MVDLVTPNIGAIALEVMPSLLSSLTNSRRKSFSNRYGWWLGVGGPRVLVGRVRGLGCRGWVLVESAVCDEFLHPGVDGGESGPAFIGVVFFAFACFQGEEVVFEVDAVEFLLVLVHWGAHDAGEGWRAHAGEDGEVFPEQAFGSAVADGEPCLFEGVFGLFDLGVPAGLGDLVPGVGQLLVGSGLEAVADLLSEFPDPCGVCGVLGVEFQAQGVQVRVLGFGDLGEVRVECLGDGLFDGGGVFEVGCLVAHDGLPVFEVESGGEVLEVFDLVEFPGFLFVGYGSPLQ